MDALDEIIGAFIGSKKLQESLEHFEAAGVTVGPICDPIDLKDHEYIRGCAVIEDYPDEDHGAIPLHTPFPRLSETPGKIRWSAPGLGQHTDEILDLLGRSEEERAQLHKAGVV